MKIMVDTAKPLQTYVFQYVHDPKIVQLFTIENLLLFGLPKRQGKHAMKYLGVFDPVGSDVEPISGSCEVVLVDWGKWDLSNGFTVHDVMRVLETVLEVHHLELTEKEKFAFVTDFFKQEGDDAWVAVEGMDVNEVPILLYDTIEAMLTSEETNE
jgi:hypothetical protein